MKNQNPHTSFEKTFIAFCVTVVFISSFAFLITVVFPRPKKQAPQEDRAAEKEYIQSQYDTREWSSSFVYDKDLGSCIKMISGGMGFIVDCEKVCNKLAHSVRDMAHCE